MDKGELKFFSFLITRSIKTVYVNQLRQIEDLLEEGAIDQDKFERMRNRILDCGNEQIRNCQETIEQYQELKGNNEYE